MNTKFKIGDIVKYNGDVYQINGIEGTQENQYMYRVKCIKQMDSDSYPCCGIGCGSEERMELCDFNGDNPPIFNADDRGTIDEIIFALKSLGKEKMISYNKEIEFLNRIRKL